MVMSKMKMKMKVDEFEEGEIVSEEDGEFLPPQLLLETRKQGHDPCHAIKNSYILDSMVMKMKVDDFEQGEIITQDFLEDGEFIPPHLLPEKRGKEKHCYDPRDGSKGRKRQRFGRVVASEIHVGDSSKPNSLGAAADIISGKEKHRHDLHRADGARGRKRERFADAHLGESSKTNSLGGAAADVRLTGDSAKRQKICDLGGSDEVTQLSNLLRATELKLKCAGVILKSQSAPDFPAAKLRHSCL